MREQNRPRESTKRIDSQVAPGPLDTEPPCIRCISLSAPRFAGRLIHLAIQAMPVNRRGACVHPQTRRPMQSADGFADQFRWSYPRLQNFAPIPRGIPAIHAAAGEIYDYIGAF